MHHAQKMPRPGVLGVKVQNRPIELFGRGKIAGPMGGQGPLISNRHLGNRLPAPRRPVAGPQHPQLRYAAAHDPSLTVGKGRTPSTATRKPIASEASPSPCTPQCKAAAGGIWEIVPRAAYKSACAGVNYPHQNFCPTRQPLRPRGRDLVGKTPQTSLIDGGGTETILPRRQRLVRRQRGKDIDASAEGPQSIVWRCPAGRPVGSPAKKALPKTPTPPCNQACGEENCCRRSRSTRAGRRLS